MPKYRYIWPVVAAWGAMIFWSFSFVWIKIAYKAYGPLTVIFSRLILSVVLLATFSLIIRRLQPISKKDLPVFVLLAFFEPFLYFMGESFGLLYVSSTVAAVIIATIPLFAPIGAWYFYREKVSLRDMTGIFISFIGVCLVVFNADFSFSASPKGVTLEFLAVFAAIGYSLTLRKLSFRYNAFSIITYQNLFGAAMFCPFWLIFESAESFNTPVHWEALGAIAMLSVFASTMAFVLFTYCVKSLGVKRSNMYINLIPVFVAVFAWMVLGDSITLQTVTGIVVVILGLFIAQFTSRKSKNQQMET